MSNVQDTSELLEALSVAAAEANPNFDEEAKLAALGMNADGTSKFKPQSMVRLNGQPLPDRVAVYRTDTGEKVMAPTAQLGNILRKVRADDPTQKAFSAKPVEKPTKPAKAIKKSCDFCSEHGVTKKFPTETQYGRHMRAFHPDEWEEQREAGGMLNSLMSATPEQMAALRALIGTDTKGTK